MTYRASRLHGRFDLLAEVLRRPADELRNQQGPEGAEWWIAQRDDDPVGCALAWLRPDRKLWLWFTCPDPGAIAPLADAIHTAEEGPIYTSADATDHLAIERLEVAGFAETMTEVAFRIPFDDALARLDRVTRPDGYRFVTALDVDRGRLHDLDTELRNDVPGTEGWRSTRAAFDEEFEDAPPFDPAGYLVAVDDTDGSLAGLIRFWRNASGPRLGLLAVTRPHRRTRLAPALLKSGLEAASGWGHDGFVTETTTANPKVLRSLRAAGQETGRRMHLVRR